MSFRSDYLDYLYGIRNNIEYDSMSDDVESIPSDDSWEDIGTYSEDSSSDTSDSSPETDIRPIMAPRMGFGGRARMIERLRAAGWPEAAGRPGTSEETETAEESGTSEQPRTSEPLDTRETQSLQLTQSRSFQPATSYRVSSERRPIQKMGTLHRLKKNSSGSARSEKFAARKKCDTFGWLRSMHRQLPTLSQRAEETLSCIEGGLDSYKTKYINLKQTGNAHMGVYRSKIHGRGLFSLVDMDPGEMVIEFVGEVVRTVMLDKRNKYYTEKGVKGIFCKLDHDYVIDGTMKGNLSRFINHSCEPNCYPKVVKINGKRHLIIISMIGIGKMDEITCDYELMSQYGQINCNCDSTECRKVLN